MFTQVSLGSAINYQHNDTGEWLPGTYAKSEAASIHPGRKPEFLTSSLVEEEAHCRKYLRSVPGKAPLFCLAWRGDGDADTERWINLRAVATETPDPVMGGHSVVWPHLWPGADLEYHLYGGGGVDTRIKITYSDAPTVYEWTPKLAPHCAFQMGGGKIPACYPCLMCGDELVTFFGTMRCTLLDSAGNYLDTDIAEAKWSLIDGQLRLTVDDAAVRDALKTATAVYVRD